MSEFTALANTAAASFADGIKVVVFIENEGVNTCLQNLLESSDLVTTDKHTYM